MKGVDMALPLEEKSLDVNGVKIAYTVTGNAGGKPVFCVHGLLSNGRDYDALAAALAAQGYRVICIDLAGRGKSDWLPEAKLYQLPTYFPYCLAVIQKEIGDAPFDWFGVSLGGMIGMFLVGGDAVKIKRLILVDIGAVIPRKGLKKVSIFAKSSSSFPSFAQAVAFLKTRCGAWGIKQEATWEHLIAHNIVEDKNGGYRMHYDPAIGAAIPNCVWTIKLWKMWYAVTCPVLLIRGGKSELMSAKIAKKMAKYYKGTDFKEVVFEECGHVPNVMEKEQIDRVLEQFSCGS